MLSRLVIVLSLVASLVACAATRPPPAASPATPVVTSTPAANEKPFAMKMYSLVMLRRGPAWSAEKTPESAKIFEGHMANIKAMARTGKLVIAGPFEADATDKNAYAGLFIFDVTDAAELKALLANDPAIAAGRLVPETLQWYGPAGLSYDGREEALKD
jgi:uncharacterized protein